MTLVYAVLLGVIQGLTEFLPVSSSAHLILARAFFGWDSEQFGMAFDVACHVGTLIAVLVYFRSEILAMVRAIPRAGTLLQPKPDPAAWMALLIVVGTIPAVVVGLAFGRIIEERLRTPAVAAVMLAVVALAFFAVERYGARRRTQASLGLVDTALIGCAQAAALVPGVSRSGSTIATGMALGLRRDESARFAFLLGVPAILAAAAKEGLPFVKHGLPPGAGLLFTAGMVSSAVVGYFAIRFFIRYVTGHSLAAFAWYRLALAATVVIWWFTR
ncbi:MAG TPA: undecaprenyl-diphosphate phosphatase [Vicinamibacterales bacterium]